VEKVEQVLAAEEQARQAIAVARDRVTSLRAGAETEARRVLGDGAERAASEASIERDRIVGEGAHGAESITEGAAASRESAVTAARARLAETAAGLAARLKG
jgi:vacuolar-type H+-ATPase subunit H